MLGSATPSVDQLLVLQAVRCRCPSTAPLSVFVSLNSPALPRELTERLLAAIVASERFLIDNKFMSGASFSMADIAAFTMISAVNRHQAWDQLTHLGHGGKATRGADVASGAVGTLRRRSFRLSNELRFAGRTAIK